MTYPSFEEAVAQLKAFLESQGTSCERIAWLGREDVVLGGRVPSFDDRAVLYHYERSVLDMSVHYAAAVDAGVVAILFQTIGAIGATTFCSMAIARTDEDADALLIAGLKFSIRSKTLEVRRITLDEWEAQAATQDDDQVMYVDWIFAL